MLQIGNYTEGSNISLLNTYYLYPERQADNKWSKDLITVIYKDLDTNKKHKVEIEQPTAKYYLLKDEYKVDNNEFFVEKDMVDEVECKYRDIEKSIAENTNNLDFFYDNIKNGNRYANKALHTHARVFNSDANIEDHYRKRFSQTYTNDVYSLHKMFFDIEADVINIKGDFPEPGEAPVNAITIVDAKEMKMYTLLLRNPKNPLIAEYEESYKQGLAIESVKGLIEKAVGGWKNVIRYGLDKMQYEMHFYDEEAEINLIADFFRLVNIKQPDFCLAWNMAFDMPYLIARVEKLGYNPTEIIAHKDFKRKVARYVEDTRALELSERGDNCIVSSYTVYMCQMIQFASRRKGQSAFSNFNLNAIGEQVAKVKKLDYSHITTSLPKLPYLDYKVFVEYNIVDTLVQYCIEHKVSDIEYIYSKCLINNTRLSKGHRQTVYLVNRAAKCFYNQGLIIGNNVNKTNEKPTEKFPGAFVANPLSISDEIKVKVAGTPQRIYDNSDDFDYKSLYPSEAREFNTAPNTQIGRIYIEQMVYKGENPFNNPLYNRGGALLEDLHSHVYLEFCKRWLGLPSIMTLYKSVIALGSMRFGVQMQYWDNNLFIPIFRTKQVVPIQRVNEHNRLINPIVRNVGKPNYDIVKDINEGDIIYEDGYMFTVRSNEEN